MLSVCLPLTGDFSMLLEQEAWGEEWTPGPGSEKLHTRGLHTGCGVGGMVEKGAFRASLGEASYG